jgi:hypothetical protein
MQILSSLNPDKDNLQNFLIKCQIEIHLEIKQSGSQHNLMKYEIKALYSYGLITRESLGGQDHKYISLHNFN